MSEYSIHTKGSVHTLHGNFGLMEKLAQVLPDAYLGEGCLILDDYSVETGDWHFLISCIKIGTPVSH